MLKARNIFEVRRHEAWPSLHAAVSSISATCSLGLRAGTRHCTKVVGAGVTWHLFSANTIVTTDPWSRSNIQSGPAHADGLLLDGCTASSPPSKSAFGLSLTRCSAQIRRWENLRSARRPQEFSSASSTMIATPPTRFPAVELGCFHCRYASLYEQPTAEMSASPRSVEQARGVWVKLMQMYITSSAPRQVNIPSRVRDCLLSKPYDPLPPHPSELTEVCRIIYELMDDSLLIPFLQSAAQGQIACSSEERDCPTGRPSPATAAAISGETHNHLGFSSLRRRRGSHRKQQHNRFREWGR
ncbi:hypothetical protein Purlil1_12471 [Purpureocillium lilacinum]|uniref:RGS domain-containing protein n=1 Tax=Purpureocillium lilacinum TaxID=33203 RepID=A0ABR0BHV8_PURLI|nr:hypothetical protein Purlil1_12471 [Purpureocillium lilacinum]